MSMEEDMRKMNSDGYEQAYIDNKKFWEEEHNRAQTQAQIQMERLSKLKKLEDASGLSVDSLISLYEEKAARISGPVTAVLELKIYDNVNDLSLAAAIYSWYKDYEKYHDDIDLKTVVDILQAKLLSDSVVRICNLMERGESLHE